MPAVAPHTPVLMLQGTGSDVGKSLLAAGLCRAYARRGVSVRPFKPQNMSNNAAVTADGGEIGRAQALQARACGLKPTIDMNPVLLKPQSEIGAQVVVQGRVVGNAKAAEYHALKPTLMARVLESFERLAGRAELVIVEGAGSASEVNLRAADIANMGFAEAADVPVALVADIDRGGVIASIVGTVALLPEAERARLKGYIVNRFRGDVALFDSAIDILRDRTGLDSFGVVPFFAEAAKLPAEDGMAVDRYATGLGDDRPIRIAVLALPRISNFDDLDPLRAEPDVAVTMVRRGEAIPGDCDLVILPGSKATLADLQALREAGWDVDIAAHLRRGGQVLGLCGGYQMLGRTLADPNGIEGPPATVDGLGLLDIETVLTGEKQLVEVGATCLLDQQIVRGYEMHVGQTTGPGTSTPMLRLDDGRPDGAVSSDGKVMGCYVHGLFATDDFRHAFLHRLKARADSGIAYEAQIEATLDALADHLEASLDLDRLWEVACAR